MPTAPVSRNTMVSPSVSKGIRVVSKLDPLGKCFYMRLWRSSPLVHHTRDYVCGFFKNRRREQAITIQRINKWRARQAKKNWTTALHDIVNGFPSPKFAQLDIAIKRMNAKRQAFRLLRHRFRRARVRLKIDAHTHCRWRIGCDTAQGDGMSPELFQEAYSRP